MCRRFLLCVDFWLRWFQCSTLKQCSEQKLLGTLLRCKLQFPTIIHATIAIHTVDQGIESCPICCNCLFGFSGIHSEICALPGVGVMIS